jgi:hypothetical protein
MAKGISALADRLDRNHKLWTSFWQDERPPNGKTCKCAESLILRGLMARKGGKKWQRSDSEWRGRFQIKPQLRSQRRFLRNRPPTRLRLPLRQAGVRPKSSEKLFILNHRL